VYNTPRSGWAVIISNRENIDCGLAIYVRSLKGTSFQYYFCIVDFLLFLGSA